jgi:hypothetical protein
MALIQGRTLLVDLRPLYVTYRGRPGTSCVTAWGVGCWEEGSKAAIGSYDPASGRFTLDWLASQGFTGASAGVSFHLEGRFAGQVTAAPPDAGAGWLPDQYVLTGSSVQTGAASPAPKGGAPEAPGSSGQVAASVTGGAPASSPFPSWVASGHSTPAVASLSAAAAVLVVVVGAATVILASRRLRW